MRKLTRWVWGSVAVLGLLVVFVATVVNPVVLNYARAALDALTVQAVNAGVGDVVTADSYGQLTDIRRDANGVITSINADVVAMNQIATQVADRAQVHLNQMGATGIAIPLGTFSGIPILVGRGLPVMLQVKLIGAVNCRFDSTFESAGINQTQHKITLYVDAVVDIVLPLYTKRTNVAIQMLFADSIIVGKVPEFMFGHIMK